MEILIVVGGVPPAFIESIKAKFGPANVEVVDQKCLATVDLASYRCFVVLGDNECIRILKRSNLKRGATIVAVTDNMGTAYNAGANAFFTVNQVGALIDFLESRIPATKPRVFRRVTP